MVIKIVEKDEEYFTIGDLIEDIKKSQRVDEAGAIYSFEGIVRGTEENKTVDKLTLTLPDKEKGLSEIETIVETAKVSLIPWYTPKPNIKAKSPTAKALVVLCSFALRPIKHAKEFLFLHLILYDLYAYIITLQKYLSTKNLPKWEIFM